jgi:glycerol-3-phosphate acyltransferase PlsY
MNNFILPRLEILQTRLFHYTLLSKISNGVLLSISAYLLGSISFGFLIGKLKGVDIRKIGSKSTTSTNVARALGWRWGIISAILDFSKGVVPTLLAKIYLFNHPWQIIIIALLPTVGHVLPVWLKFRGGKGASTFYAATLTLIGLKYFLLFFLFWILILAITKTMSMANILFPWVLVILISLFFPLYYVVFAFLGASFLLFAFRENIKRIKEGIEPKISFRW